MSYTRKSYVGGAVAATLNGNLNAGVLTLSLTGTNSSWAGLGGSGTSLPFYLAINYGTSTEEKVLVTSTDINWASGSVSVSVVRGQDGTLDQYHATGATVVPVMTATDLDEANYVVTETVGKVTGAGQILYGDGLNSIATLAAGTSGYFLKSNNSGAPSWDRPSNVWSGSTSYTVSGFSKYLVLADVTLTQAASAVTAGEYQLAAGGKTVYGYSAGLANSRTTINLTTIVTASGTISAVATKNNGTGTVGTPSLIVIGLN
jgi:hypothetical protein